MGARRRIVAEVHQSLGRLAWPEDVVPQWSSFSSGDRANL